MRSAQIARLKSSICDITEATGVVVELCTPARPTQRQTKLSPTSFSPKADRNAFGKVVRANVVALWTSEEARLPFGSTKLRPFVGVASALVSFASGRLSVIKESFDRVDAEQAGDPVAGVAGRVDGFDAVA